MATTTPVPTISVISTPIPTIHVTTAPTHAAVAGPTRPPYTYSPQAVQVNIPPSSSAWWQSWFTQSNVWFVLCFIVVYILIFTLMKLLLGETISNAAASLVIDCIALVILAIWIVAYFVSNPTPTAVYDPLGNGMIWLRNFFDVPSNFLFLTLVMIFMYLLFFVLQIPMGGYKPYSIRFIEILMWVFYLTDIFAVIFLFLFGFSMTDLILNPMINGWYSLAAGSLTAQATPVTQGSDTAGTESTVGGTTADTTAAGVPVPPGQPGQPVNQCVPPVPTTLPPQCTDRTIPYIVRDTSGNIVNMQNLRNEVCLNVAKQTATVAPTQVPVNQEVFNISNNLYTYQQAQDVCSSYGARLATYDEIEAAYVDGGEWCNYGWSASQMALFPTQKDTWNRLQRTQNHKNDCGRPGINGGYMENPEFQFGANCYGTKPTPGPYVSVAKEPSDRFPEEEIRVAHQQILTTPIQVSQFNREKWSEYQH